MKTIGLGQTLEILATCGVLASVIVLAVEISGNTAAIRQQEVGALLDQEQALLMATTSEDLAALYVKSLYNPSELSRIELQRITGLLATRASILLRVFSAYTNGIATEEQRMSQLNSVPIYFGTRFGRVWWGLYRGDYTENPAFVAAIDGALETSRIVPDDAWLLELERLTQQVGQ